MQVKGTSKVGARKDGSGLLKSAEAGNWMGHVDLRNFSNRNFGIYNTGMKRKTVRAKHFGCMREKEHFLSRGNMRVTEVGWFDSQYERLCQTPPPSQDICRVRYLCITNTVPASSSTHLPPSSLHNRRLRVPNLALFHCNLVLTGRRLAGLELVQVPATDSQTTLVLVHALAEALDIVCARTRLRHLSRRRVSGLVLGGEFSVLRRGFGGGRGTASKPAADCVADGGSYCDTAVKKRVSQMHIA
jgi:hypothetical protein